MKKLILLITIVALTLSSYSNEWEDTFLAEWTLIELECADSLNFYILTGNGYDTNIYRSSDGGFNWELLNDDLPTKKTVNDISVPDPGNIFVVFKNGDIDISNDSGKSFSFVDPADISSITNITMYNKDIGVVEGGYLITMNGWETYWLLELKDNIGSLTNATFINDSTVFSLAGRSNNWYLFKSNILSKSYEKFHIDSSVYISCLLSFDNNLIFACGKSNSITGGSGHDAIYKSTDGGESWRRVLDLYTAGSKISGLVPFGLQSIAFKDEKTGIAVGQFGKILYTYDGGESWIYEHNLHDTISKYIPPTMIVRYAGDTPILATFNGHFFRMVEDTYAPGPDDTLSISGRVWEGDKGQAGIPLAIGYRVTMTDEDGYYKFGQLPSGNYTVRALNKYYDDGHPNLQDYYYKPYAYHPEQHEFELKGDTTGIDFNAEDIRDYYNLSGAVTDIDGKGIAGIELSMGDSLTTTTSDGSYEFIRLEKKQYNVTPISEGYIYTPGTYVIGLINDTASINFEAIPDTTNFIDSPAPDTLGLRIENGRLSFTNLIDISGMTLTISDLTGREIINSPLKYEHDISSLSTGVYIVMIRKRGELVGSYKVVIE